MGFVPSGFTLALGVTVWFSLAGAFLTGVAPDVALFVGLVAVPVLFEAGTAAFLMLGPGVRGFGKVFCVPRGVRVRVTVGLETGVFFAGVDVDGVDGVAGAFFAGVVVDGVDADGVAFDWMGSAFFVPIGVRVEAAGVLTGVEVEALFVAADVVLFSFAGAFFTGVGACLVAAGVDVAGVFLTGVALLAVVVGLLAVDFAPSATLEILATLAVGGIRKRTCLT